MTAVTARPITMAVTDQSRRNGIDRAPSTRREGQGAVDDGRGPVPDIADGDDDEWLPVPISDRAMMIQQDIAVGQRPPDPDQDEDEARSKTRSK